MVSGSLCGWGDSLIPWFTLAVRLVTPTAARLARLENRERERFGPRLDPGGDLYDEHRTFMAWAEQLTCRRLTLDGCLTVEELTETGNRIFSRDYAAE